MICVIDGDTVAFACAASAEDTDEPWIACSRAQTMLERILQDCETTAYEVWLTGENNFRQEIYPEYKANRIGAYRPKWERAVKEYITLDWKANWSSGCEADDMCGVRLMDLKDNGILAHIDKDLNMIPGWHYNWELVRKGNTIRHADKYFVTPEEADRFFWTQLVTGDPTDNIKGIPGMGPKKTEKLLSECKTNREFYDTISPLFSCEEEMELNANCVYIWRKLNDNWKNLLNETTVS